MTYPRNTSDSLDRPKDFFNGVIIETQGIVQHAASIRQRTESLASTVAQSVEQRSVSLLKAAIEANESAGRELQRDVDRMRGLISAVDRKLAAFQNRKARA